MNQTDTLITTRASDEEMQQGWHDLKLRVAQLEMERAALEQQAKDLRSLLERVIEHRQKSHTELVLLLSGLVSKLSINDVGVIVSKLVEHNDHVTEVCTALAKGKTEASHIQPRILRALDQTKRELLAAVKPVMDEIISLEAPLSEDMLRSLVANPGLFFSPAVVRANRCFVKGQVPRERIIKEFGDAALIFFNDMTTDPKLNPRPKPEDIVLAFRSDFESVFQQNAGVIPEKRQQLAALQQRVQRSRAATDEARAQKNAFLRLSFILELLHYYENQNTEAPDVIFAQRLPAVVEQLALPTPQDGLDEKLIVQAESLLAFIINFDHRLMVINNMGKGSTTGRTLKFVLRLRAEKEADSNPLILTEVLPEFVKHLVPAQKPPQPAALNAVLRFLCPALQKLVLKGVMNSDRLRKEEAEALGRAAAKELGLTDMDSQPPQVALTPEMERQLAWEKIKDLISSRAEPGLIANAIRERLHAKYDSDEVRQSWLVLIEADAISFIRAFCQLPYLPSGKTDPIAQPILETYVTRLTHEKYAATYAKVMNSLKNMFKAKPDSPTIVNFISLVRWVDAAAARRLSADIGMP
jgi:hypothetical protein